MAFSAKFIRAQLRFLKPLMENLSLEQIRQGQDKIGQLMEVIHRKSVIIKDHPFDKFTGAWAIPQDERRGGVIQIGRAHV